MKPSPAQLIRWPAELLAHTPHIRSNDPMRCGYCGAYWPFDTEHSCADLERARAAREEDTRGNC